MAKYLKTRHLTVGIGINHNGSECNEPDCPWTTGFVEMPPNVVREYVMAFKKDKIRVPGRMLLGILEEQVTT